MCYSSVLIPRLHLQGTIPEDWGASGSLPNLKTLTLSFNFELSGQLPAQWGSDGSSLQNLTSVEITNCDLSGPLPPGWAGNLPSLTKLNVSANALSGAPVCFHARAQTHPAEYHRRARDSRRTAPPSWAHLLACFSSRIPFAVTVKQEIWEGFLGLVSKGIWCRDPPSAVEYPQPDHASHRQEQPHRHDSSVLGDEWLLEPAQHAADGCQPPEWDHPRDVSVQTNCQTYRSLS